MAKKKITPEKAVVKYVLEFYRSADLKGVFVMTKEDFEAVKDMNGSEIHYGEVAGKHSDVSADLLLEEIEILTEDPEEIRVFEKLCPEGAGFSFMGYWFNDDRARDDGYEASTMKSQYKNAEEALKDYPSIKSKKMQAAFIESYNQHKEDK